jgi:L-fuculose-phosphate aldolase
MQLPDERRTLVEYARRLRSDGLVIGTAGNISARSGLLVAITPSGVDYDEMTPESACVVDLDGGLVEGDLDPSTELPLHLAIQRMGAGGAVVHTHSPYATALSLVVDEIPPIHYLLAELGGPVRTAPYAAPGSEELAVSVRRALEDRSAALLQNHGAVTTAETIERAYARSVLLESLARTFFLARLVGEPRLLPPGELERLGEFVCGYASRAAGRPPSHTDTAARTG